MIDTAILPVQEKVLDRPIPSYLPVADARNQVNLFGDTSQDDYLEGLCGVAQEIVEDYIGQYLETVSTQCNYLRFNQTGMAIPQPNISNLVVKYWDEHDILQTLSPSVYLVDTTVNPILLRTRNAQAFPAALSAVRTAPVQITYDSILYGADQDMNVERIRQAMLLMVTHWYNNRSDTDMANRKEIPYGFLRLLNKYRTATL